MGSVKGGGPGMNVCPGAVGVLKPGADRGDPWVMTWGGCCWGCSFRDGTG